MRILLAAAWFAGCAWAQFNNVVVFNAANYALESQFAPGSLIRIENGDYPSVNSPASAQLLPLSGPAIALPIVGSIDRFSVTALLPKNAPLGPARIQATFNGVDEGSVRLTIVPSSFGLYTNGPVATAQNVVNGVAQTNSLTQPSRPNQLVTLWGTGLGSAGLGQITILIGGRPAVVEYAGPAPGSPGLDQINVRVPDDPLMPDGCYVAVDVRVEGLLANRGSISIARGNAATCTHPLGLTADQLKTLDGGGTVNFALAFLDSSVGPRYNYDALTDIYGTDWTRFNREDYAGFSVMPMDALDVSINSKPLVSDDALFRCSTEGERDLVYFGFDSAAPVAGFGNPGSVKLAGPNGYAFQIETSALFYGPINGSIDGSSPAFPLDSVPDSLFVPGTWTLSQAAGPGLAPFSIALAVGPAIRVLNASGLTLNRQHGATLRWNPQGFSNNQIVTVSLYTGDSGNPEPFTCIGPAQAGSLTIPAEVFAGLPSAADPNNPYYLDVNLDTRVGNFSTFQIPVGFGSTVFGGFHLNSYEEIPVTIE